jgi:integrase
MLNWSVRQGYIPNNPCHAVEPIKQAKTHREQWQPDDAERFLTAAAKTWYFPVLFAAIMTGLRRGELQALQWQDIDGDKLYVRRTYSKHGREIKTTKTAAGIRTIPLGKDMQAMLELHRKRVRHDPEDFVFPSMTGSMLSGDNMLRAVHQICEHAGIPHIRFHDLRVFAGSLVASQTHDPAILQAFLGHSDPRTSLAIYRQVMHHERSQMALERSSLQTTDKTTDTTKKDELS